jgi:hypothetical protein
MFTGVKTPLVNIVFLGFCRWEPELFGAILKRAVVHLRHHSIYSYKQHQMKTPFGRAPTGSSFSGSRGS